MTTVLITGWQAGLKKVSLTKLIRAYAGYDLAKGKHCVDDLLEGKPIFLSEMPTGQAENFVAQARELGAVCESALHKVVAFEA